MAKYSDIVIVADTGDPDYGDTYWVDLGAREPKGLKPYLTPGAAPIGRFERPYGGGRDFVKGATVLTEIDKAIWDERGERMDYGEPYKGTFRIVYYPSNTAKQKRILAHVKVTEYGVGTEYTPYGNRFKRARAAYPS